MSTGRHRYPTRTYLSWLESRFYNFVLFYVLFTFMLFYYFYFLLCHIVDKYTVKVTFIRSLLKIFCTLLHTSDIHSLYGKIPTEPRTLKFQWFPGPWLEGIYGSLLT